MQIVKVKDDGNFYVTTLKPSKSQIKNAIIEGQVIYDLSSLSDIRSADNFIIANSDTDFKSDVIFDETNPNIYYQEEINSKDNINKRTDKSKYLTDNEVKQLEKDKQNFETYVSKLINGELSPLAQIRVLEHLPSAYNNIPELKGKKVVINQDIYKKIIDLPNKFNKNHNIDRKRALKLPQFISDPLYILQSTSRGNEHRFVVVTNSKGNKPSEKLSIILNPNNNVAVVSAYDEKIDISEEKKANRVLYDKKKELSKTLSASKTVTIDNSNNSIPNSDTDFNPDVIFDETNPNIYYQKDKYLISDENKTEIQGYKNFVNKVFKQKLTNKEKSKPYIIGNTPKSLTEAGLSDDKLAIGFSIIEKAKNEKNSDHKLSETTIENIVEALHNPIAVIKDEIKTNEKSNNRYGIILDLKENDNFVMVSIESGKNLGSGNIVNDIRTIHSRKSFAPMVNKAVNANRLLKIKESKLKDLFLGYQSDSISDGGQTSLVDIIKQKYKNTNILFQSAYHGSAKDFDNFDLSSYALSGEGAMAHGYGVYTAKNKEVSEDYRKKLLPYDFDNIGMQITVNQGIRDVIYTKKATNTYGFSEDGIYEKRPDDYFNEALLYIEKTNNDKEKAIKEVQEKIDDYRENGDISNARFYLEVKEILQSYDFDITHNPEGMGQLFEVDIPEDDVLMDEDLPFEKQPKKVQEILKKITDDYKNTAFGESFLTRSIENGNGKQIYNNLVQAFLDNINGDSLNDYDINEYDELNAQKQASLLLNKYGIKGIKYDGYRDGECVVVFDDKAVEIIQKFYQEEYGDDSNITDTEKGIMNAKGFFYEKTLFDGTLKDNIMVLIDQKADASTLVHEFGHIYLQALNRLAKTSPRAKEQLLTYL